MWAKPARQQRPDLFHGIDMDFTKTVSIFISGIFSSSMVGSVSKVETATLMALICKMLFPSMSTFETPPHGSRSYGRIPRHTGGYKYCPHPYTQVPRDDRVFDE